MRRAPEVAALAAIVAMAASCGRSEPSAPASTAKAPAPATVPQAAANEGSEEAQAGAVSVEIAATVDGAQYPLKTMGQCTYTGAAAVYDVPAAQWHAMVHANGQPLSYTNLTIWEFKDHTDAGLARPPDPRRVPPPVDCERRDAGRLGHRARGACRRGRDALVRGEGQPRRGSSDRRALFEDDRSDRGRRPLARERAVKASAPTSAHARASTE